MLFEHAKWAYLQLLSIGTALKNMINLPPHELHWFRSFSSKKSRKLKCQERGQELQQPTTEAYWHGSLSMEEFFWAIRAIQDGGDQWEPGNKLLLQVRRERGANLRGSEEGSKTMELDLIMEWNFEEEDCLEKRLNSTERKWCKERTLVNQRQSHAEFLTPCDGWHVEKKCGKKYIRKTLMTDVNLIMAKGIAKNLAYGGICHKTGISKTKRMVKPRANHREVLSLRLRDLSTKWKPFHAKEDVSGFWLARVANGAKQMFKISKYFPSSKTIAWQPVKHLGTFLCFLDPLCDCFTDF